MKDINVSFVIFTIAVFIFLLLPPVFKEGMFMDGLMYAVISKNLAEGPGIFWTPYFSATFLPEFYEHPPLVFGIQSLFFKILGNSFFVEKFYSFLSAAIQALLIIFIWQKIFIAENKKYAWVPVLFWVTIPLCFWSYSNNLLENTMAVFTSISVYYQILYFLSVKKRSLFLLLSGISVFLAFLCKGLPALFPLALPFIFWITLKKDSLWFYTKSFFILLVPVFILAFIVYMIPEANHSLTTYFSTQVFESLAGERVQDERYFILVKLIKELIPLIILTVILYLFRRKIFDKKNNLQIETWIFLFIALSASLPIMISPKQLGFYLVPSFPFYALFFASLNYNTIKKLINKIPNTISNYIYYSGWLLLTASVVLSIFQYGNYQRDEILIKDIKQAAEITGSNKIISICPSMYDNWSLHGYFMRYYKISVSPGQSYPYMFVDNECYNSGVNGKVFRLRNHLLIQNFNN